MELYLSVKHREVAPVLLEAVHRVAVISFRPMDDLSLVVTLAADRVKFIRKRVVVETRNQLAQPIKLFISKLSPQGVNVF